MTTFISWQVTAHRAHGCHSLLLTQSPSQRWSSGSTSQLQFPFHVLDLKHHCHEGSHGWVAKRQYCACCAPEFGFQNPSLATLVTGDPIHIHGLQEHLPSHSYTPTTRHTYSKFKQNKTTAKISGVGCLQTLANGCTKIVRLLSSKLLFFTLIFFC